MLSFIVRRLGQSVFVLLGVTVGAFLLVHLSGDPIKLMLPFDATPEQIAATRAYYGLDEPLPVQYGRFLAHAAQGDFGQSLRGNQPALGLVLERLPATALLAMTALGLALLVAFPVGILAALRPHTLQDQGAMLFALFGQSTPVFWLGIMLILLFSVQLRLLPTGGSGGPQYLVLPAITLGLYSAARTARLVRSGMLEVLAEDYVRTGRAKGLRPRSLLLGHALRNALIPVVTVVGLDLATLLGGAVITETIFGWPGVGRLAVQAIQQRDYPVVQAAVFVVASGYVVLNLAVDALYAYLDPRIRLA
jgi:ABC-type dipeptide/oligopeptide/nickel transport system permease component